MENIEEPEETEETEKGIRLTYRARQNERENLESFLKMWTWISARRVASGNEVILTDAEWQLVCAAAGRIKRDYENALVRGRAAREKRQGSGSGAAYSKERRTRLDAQKEFCKWTQEKKPAAALSDSDEKVYLLKFEETELLDRISEIIELKLEASRRRAAAAALVRKPIPIAAQSLGGQRGSAGKGKNGKGRAGRRKVYNPSPATLAKRRQREREKQTALERN